MDEANDFLWSFSALSIIIREMGTLCYALLKCPTSLEADAYQEYPVCMIVSFTSFAMAKYEQQPCTYFSGCDRDKAMLSELEW